MKVISLVFLGLLGFILASAEAREHNLARPSQTITLKRFLDGEILENSDLTDDLLQMSDDDRNQASTYAREIRKSYPVNYLEDVLKEDSSDKDKEVKYVTSLKSQIQNHKYFILGGVSVLVILLIELLCYKFRDSCSPAK